MVDQSPMLPQKDITEFTGFEPVLPSVWKDHEDGVIAMWCGADADFGWFQVDNKGRLLLMRRYKSFPNDLVPGFRFDKFRSGVIDKLPVPGFPFGLSLRGDWTEVNLKELVGLKNLTALSLSNVQVADAGLRHLAGLTNLTALDLFNMHVTDAGLEGIDALKNLTVLNLWSNEITDASLKLIAGLESLTTLILFRTEVTDAGLKYLYELKNLTKLGLTCTRVTSAGIDELKKALPGCNIIN